MDPFNPTASSPGQPAPRPSADEDRSASRFFSLNQLIGMLFLLSQVIFVLQTHFFAESPHLLTPVEGLTRYELHATMAQRPLTASGIRDRYGIAFRDEAPLTVGAVRAVIVHQEASAPEWSALYVRLRTREANGTEDYWLWPQE